MFRQGLWILSPITSRITYPIIAKQQVLGNWQLANTNEKFVAWVGNAEKLEELCLWHRSSNCRSYAHRPSQVCVCTLPRSDGTWGWALLSSEACPACPSPIAEALRAVDVQFVFAQCRGLLGRAVLWGSDPCLLPLTWAPVLHRCLPVSSACNFFFFFFPMFDFSAGLSRTQWDFAVWPFFNLWTKSGVTYWEDSFQVPSYLVPNQVRQTANAKLHKKCFCISHHSAFKDTSVVSTHPHTWSETSLFFVSTTEPLTADPLRKGLCSSRIQAPQGWAGLAQVRDVPLLTLVGSSAWSAAVVPMWLKSNIWTGSDSPCIHGHGKLIVCYRLFVFGKRRWQEPVVADWYWI